MARPRSSIRGSQKTVNKSGYRPVLIVLGIVLILRLIHLAFAMFSPLSFQLSPDEDYYMRFALSVAQGNGGSTAQFAFMDPAYGYIAGMVFRIFGGSLFALYILQILLDTFTAFCLILIGRELQRPRAGLLAGLVYGFTVTGHPLLHNDVENHLGCELHDRLGSVRAHAFAQAQNVRLAAVRVVVRVRDRAAFHAAAYGGPGSVASALAQHGSGATRATGSRARSSHADPRAGICRSRCSPCATCAPSALFRRCLPTAALYCISGIIPTIETADNWIPSFVSYWHPTDIYRGYTEEAQKRLGRKLTPREVDSYWRGQAMDYIFSHPSHVAGNILRKFALFVAYPEIPNDRSLADERLFSPILRILPSPFGWLFALGIPGFVLLLLRDRRAWLLMAPIATVLVTVTLFDSIDRFRFQAVPLFALAAALFLEFLYEYINQQKTRQAVLMLLACAVLGTVSVSLAGSSPLQPPRWDKAVWGYLRMGNQAAAKKLALKAAEEQPESYRIQSALGLIAASEGDYAGAANYYRRAVELRPNSHVDHYRLALMLVKIGLQDEAVEHAAAAVRIAPQPEYRALLQELRAGR